MMAAWAAAGSESRGVPPASHEPPHNRGEAAMLNWAILFLIIALVAAVLGASGVAGAASNIAWILFVVFLILFVVSLITGPRVRV